MDYTPIIPALFWSLLLFAVLTALVTLLRPRFIGAIGEALVSRKLRRYCAEVADDLILPDGRGGLTQVDHFALTPTGLLVVETKNYGGLILGQARDQTWTQCIGRQRHKLQNPLRQNYGHIKTVQALAPGVPVSGLVVFANRAQFPKGQPSGVVMLSDLRRMAGQDVGADVPQTYRQAWEAVVAQSRTDRAARKAHLSGVRQRKRARA
jgi:hypothetical protein